MTFSDGQGCGWDLVEWLTKQLIFEHDVLVEAEAWDTWASGTRFDSRRMDCTERPSFVHHNGVGGACNKLFVRASMAQLMFGLGQMINDSDLILNQGDGPMASLHKPGSWKPYEVWIERA